MWQAELQQPATPVERPAEIAVFGATECPIEKKHLAVCLIQGLLIPLGLSVRILSGRFRVRSRGAKSLAGQMCASAKSLGNDRRVFIHESDHHPFEADPIPRESPANSPPAAPPVREAALSRPSGGSECQRRATALRPPLDSRGIVRSGRVVLPVTAARQGGLFNFQEVLLMQLPRDWTDGSTCVPRLRTGVNCLRNTGPHTPEGKAASKQNAITHGLTARQTVLPGESQADFDALLESLHAGYEPATGIEVQLTGEIAACTWRLARARSREAQILESRNDLFSATGESPAFDRVLRYMNSIERQLNRAVVRLEHVQASRRRHEKEHQALAAPQAAQLNLEDERPKVRTATASAAAQPAEFVLQTVEDKPVQPTVSQPAAVARTVEKAAA